MARMVKKSGSRKRFAEGGTSDRYQAKYDRKIADIESDYKKAMARKTGRAAEVAKAKYDQRMADAKDDLAKWRGSDRTETRAAERAAERNLSLTRRVGARAPLNIEKDQPSLDKYIKPVDVDTKSLIKNATPTAPAPRVRRVKPSSAPRVTPRVTSTSSANKNEDIVVTAPKQKPSMQPPKKTQQPPKKKTETYLGEELPANLRGSAASRARMGVVLKKANPFYWAARGVDALLTPDVSPKPKPKPPAKPKVDPEKAARLAKLKAAAEAPGASFFAKDRYKSALASGMYKKGGKITAKATKAGKAMVKKSADTMGRAMVKKYAKGGSVNGIAIRGKTRAPMKKGK